MSEVYAKVSFVDASFINFANTLVLLLLLKLIEVLFFYSILLICDFKVSLIQLKNSSVVEI